MKKLIKRIKTFFTNDLGEEKGIKANDYGAINVFVYAVKVSWKYNKIYILAIMIAGISMSLFELTGVLIPKVVLGLVEQNVTTKTLVISLVVVGIIAIFFNYTQGKSDIVTEYGFDKVQYHLMGNYLKKVFYTDYKNMEIRTSWIWRNGQEEQPTIIPGFMAIV